MKIRNTHKLKQRVEEIMTIRSWIRQFAAGSILVAILVTLPFSPALGQGVGVEVDEPLIPQGTDVFDLNLEQSKYPPAKPGALVCEPLKAALTEPRAVPCDP